MESTKDTLFGFSNFKPNTVFENNIYESLSLLFKNVSEYFSFLDEDLKFSEKDKNILTNYITKNAHLHTHSLSKLSIFFNNFYGFLGKLIAYLLVLWLANKFSVKSKSAQFLIQVILSWVFIFSTLPILTGPILLIVAWRLILSAYLKYGLSNKYSVMSPLDAVWSYEAQNSASTCIGMHILKGSCSAQKFKKLWTNKVINYKNQDGKTPYERFKWKIVTIFGFVCWKKNNDKFSIDEHVKLLENDKKFWTEEEIFSEIGQLQGTSLNKGRNGPPPWEILLIPNLKLKNCTNSNEKFYGIIYRIHHCLMDGISMGNILYRMADKNFNFSVDPVAPLKSSKISVLIGSFLSSLLIPHTIIANIFFFEHNLLHNNNTLSGPKKINWTRPIFLDAVKKIKTRTQTSVFTVLLSCLTGSLRKIYEKHGEKVPNLIHACPPVAILPYPDRDPKNRFSVILYPLKTGIENSEKRLDEVFKTAKKLASSPEVLTNFYVIYILGLFPSFLCEKLSKLAHATVTFSNIPGPLNGVSLMDGNEIVDIGAWVPIKNRIGIGMALFSYNDKIRVTFISDKESLANEDDLDDLRDYFEIEIQNLGMELKTDQIFSTI